MAGPLVGRVPPVPRQSNGGNMARWKASWTEPPVWALVQEGLVPQRRPGQVVGLENRTTHQVAGGREAREAVGARLLYLPPSSPDFSPIAEGWSNIKAIVRPKAARTLEHLWQAITEAFAAITSQEAQGWFTHAGDRAQSN